MINKMTEFKELIHSVLNKLKRKRETFQENDELTSVVVKCRGYEERNKTPHFKKSANGEIVVCIPIVDHDGKALVPMVVEPGNIEDALSDMRVEYDPEDWEIEANEAFHEATLPSDKKRYWFLKNYNSDPVRIWKIDDESALRTAAKKSIGHSPQIVYKESERLIEHLFDVPERIKMHAGYVSLNIGDWQTAGMEWFNLRCKQRVLISPRRFEAKSVLDTQLDHVDELAMKGWVEIDKAPIADVFHLDLHTVVMGESRERKTRDAHVIVFPNEMVVFACTSPYTPIYDKFCRFVRISDSSAEPQWQMTDLGFPAKLWFAHRELILKNENVQSAILTWREDRYNLPMISSFEALNTFCEQNRTTLLGDQTGDFCIFRGGNIKDPFLLWSLVEDDFVTQELLAPPYTIKTKLEETENNVVWTSDVMEIPHAECSIRTKDGRTYRTNGRYLFQVASFSVRAISTAHFVRRNDHVSVLSFRDMTAKGWNPLILHDFMDLPKNTVNDNGVPLDTLLNLKATSVGGIGVEREILFSRKLMRVI